MTGKVIVLTGASSGIGAEAAVVLAGMGARVVPIGRDQTKLAAVAERMRAAGQPEIDVVQADFASMAEVRRVAAQLLATYPRIDVLVNNAGVIEAKRELTLDGFERTFAINHLAPFLLTYLLHDRLVASAPARVITTSSDAHKAGKIRFDDLQGEQGWSSFRAYSASKLANALFSAELARQTAGTGVTSNALHPGVVRTGWGRDSWWMTIAQRVVPFAFATPLQGARTIVHLASSDEGGVVSGEFYGPKAAPMSVSAKANDPEVGARLWTSSKELLHLG